jgi:cobalt-zinc-cadmium efflux system membrane fusion protein
VEATQTVSRSTHFEAPGVLALDETRTARIGSMVEGKIVSLSAEVGARVPAGAVLADIHSHVIHETWAEYRKAIADRKRRMTELTYTVQAEERARRLYADKAISLQEVQRAQVDRVAAEQALDMVKTEVRRTEEALEHLGITSGEDPSGESGEKIPVKSPIAGAVLEKNVTTGTAVTSGMQLFVVSDLSILWALAEVDETKLPRVKVGFPVEVRVAAYPGEIFPGTIIFVGDTLDPKTRRVTVRCRVPNSQGRLKPQMYATLSLGEGDPRPVVIIPSQAVQEMDGKIVVFIATDAGKFFPREVTLGPEAEGRVEVLSGLQPGEKVATVGSFLLKSEWLKATVAIEE